MDIPSNSPSAERKIAGPNARRAKTRRKRWLRFLRSRSVLLGALQVADAAIKVADHAVKLWQFIRNLVR